MVDGHSEYIDEVRDSVVIFVLGGPGAGKGTQSVLLASKYDFVHLSAGDLLREERNRSGSEYGELINACIHDGKIVPMHITIGLLKRAMIVSGKRRFLIDGFPRDISQGEEFERLVCVSKAMLFFSCPEPVLMDRLLHRGKTSERIDDNVSSIHKRLVTYREQTLPVKEWARKAGKLFEIDSSGPVDRVFSSCCSIFESHNFAQ